MKPDAQFVTDLARLQSTIALSVQLFELLHPNFHIDAIHSIPAEQPGNAPDVTATIALRQTRFPLLHQ